ncbi:MAG: hypothetical protein ABJG41_10900 [Cyclobacteriaceae bacterium]
MKKEGMKEISQVGHKDGLVNVIPNMRHEGERISLLYETAALHCYYGCAWCHEIVTLRSQGRYEVDIAALVYLANLRQIHAPTAWFKRPEGKGILLIEHDKKHKTFLRELVYPNLITAHYNVFLTEK